MTDVLTQLRTDWTRATALPVPDGAAMYRVLQAAHAAGIDAGAVTGLVRHARLTQAERDALPEDMFAVPKKRQLPIRDPDHVRDAWDMVDRTADLTDAERAEARRRILARAHTLHLDTAGWTK